MLGRLLPLALACLAAGCSSTPQGNPTLPGSAGTSSSSGGASAGGASTGGGASAGGASGGSVATSFACDTTARPPVASLRRLTMSQYRNTLTDFVALATGSAAEAAAVLSELSAPLAELPTDRR